MSQSVKLTGAIWPTVGNPSPLISVTQIKPPPGFEPRSPACETDELPTELHPTQIIIFTVNRSIWYQ